LLTPLVVLTLVALAFVGYLWVTQRSLIYLPERSAPPASSFPLAGEAVSFQTDDGLSLSGWFLPAAAAEEPPRPGPGVLVLNGNAGHRAYRVPLALALHDMGASVLLFDYRGYGGNPGEPTEDGLRRDARAALAFLEARGEVDSDRIAVFGESLGAAVAVALAIERPPAALVLRSPFSSIAEVGRHHYPWLPVIDPLLWDHYPVASSMAGVRAPVLVVAGDADEIVPPDQSRAVFEAADEPKRWLLISGAHHNDPALLDGPELRDAMRSFLADHEVLDR
jgi:fermentation-respiration switch protein FrsA (DUF1100 family)